MKEVKLVLSPQTYNTIIQAVQEIPWKLAQPVFQEIEPQVRAALAQQEEKVPVPSIREVEAKEDR